MAVATEQAMPISSVLYKNTGGILLPPPGVIQSTGRADAPVKSTHQIKTVFDK
jgi:hypothetical protein